jgi:hypothetical protein
MNPMSSTRTLAHWLDCHDFPDEYERMWAELAALEENGGDRACVCPKSSERWEYMGTQMERGEWKHCFRHRHHPVSQRLEYRMIPSTIEPI